MSQAGRYIKGSTRGYYPGRFVSVVVDSQPLHSLVTPRNRTPLTFRKVCVSWTYRKRGVYMPPQSSTFGTAAAFWSWLETDRQWSGRVIVIAPIASDALTLLQFWDRLTTEGVTRIGSPGTGVSPAGQQSSTRGYVMRRLLTRGKPDIIDYRRGTTSYLWLSGIQYLDMTPNEIATAIGYTRVPDINPDLGESALNWTAHELSRLWLAAAVRLAEWWVPLQAGPFPRTVASAAAMFMRSRVPVKTLCTHHNVYAGKLERLACHGGRASVWSYHHYCPGGPSARDDDLPFPPSRHGGRPGPLYHYDVRSMYPTILAEHKFPTKLLGVENEIRLSYLSSLCETFCVIANVSLDTQAAEYPHRYAGHVLYPTGSYSSVLSTPEILSALSDGAIRLCHGCAVYAVGTPYTRAASELIALRQAEKDKGNVGWETFTKLLSNSMTGRLAMRSGRWIPQPALDVEGRWGEELVVNIPRDTTTRLRWTAGLCEEMVRDDVGPGTLTAGYAHVTAYGRLRMRRIREALPVWSVVQQDTDGLWVTAAGHAAMQTLLASNDPRTRGIRLVDTARYVRFWTPKHYCHDGTWVTSGMHDPIFDSGTASYTDTATVNPVHTGSDGPPRIIYSVTRHGKLGREPLDCVVGDHGWAVPLELPLLPRGGRGGGGGGGGGGLF